MAIALLMLMMSGVGPSGPDNAAGDGLESGQIDGAQFVYEICGRVVNM
jgi:hypothetical protein